MTQPVRARIVRSVREIRAMTEPALLVWCLFVATMPFYIVRSGLPQPAELCMLALIPTAWKQRRSLGPALRSTMRPLRLFTIWVFVVNYGWAIAVQHIDYKDYGLFPLYYLFNAIVFFIGLVSYQRYGAKFLRATFNSVFVAVMVQVVASFFYRSGTLRGALFFNSPNQLGYYALLAACLIATIQRRGVGIKIGRASIALAGCGYLAILSASRASLAAIALLAVLLFFSNPRVILVGALAAFALLSFGGPILDAMAFSKQRFENDSRPGTSFAVERGYDRLWRYKEYLIAGAGEGDSLRFSDGPKKLNEIHSAAGTILFSYGVVGSLLFLMFLYRVIHGATLRAMLMLSPIMAYTVSHQALRFAMLWAVLAIFVSLKVPIETPAPAKAARPKRVPRAAPVLAPSS